MLRLRPPRVSSFGGRQTSPCALDDQLRLHLRQAGHHTKEKAARWRLGVDAIGQALEVDTLALHLIDQIDQPFNAATEAIQFPDDQGVRFTQMGQGLFQAGAIGLGFLGERGIRLRGLPSAKGSVQWASASSGVAAIRGSQSS
jgi:hypothetical protein